MELEHGFAVAAPIDAVWAAMIDVERVLSCVPDTRVIGRAGADSYDVEFTVAVGVLTTTSEGNITLAERDDAAHREVFRVITKDSDGGTMADATLTIVLTQSADQTDAAIQSSVEIGGLAALIKEATFDEVAADKIRTFAANLESLLRQSSPSS